MNSLKKTRQIENKRKNQHYPDYNIYQLEYLEEFWRRAIIQTPVKEPQLMLVWKTDKEWYNDNNVLAYCYMLSSIAI